MIKKGFKDVHVFSGKIEVRSFNFWIGGYKLEHTAIYSKN